jgi:diaminohydroxyphosphoribosylaminopyrimidine deaminase/5-amino-6-(5-phosphoribosylamino)uracil reductase
MGNKQTEKARYLEMAGVEVLEAELDEKGHFDLNALMSYLAKREVESLLIEGGASLNDSALRAGVVNEVHFYMSPQIIGGEQAKTAIGGLGFSKLSETLSLKEVSVETLGRDWLFRGLVETNT